MSILEKNSELEEWSNWKYNTWYNANIRKRIRYSFVRQYWDMPIEEIINRKMLVPKAAEYIVTRLSDENIRTIDAIVSNDVASLMDLLDMIPTEQQARQICTVSRVKPHELRLLLQRVYKHLPFGAQMRQLVEKDDTERQRYIDSLLPLKLGHSLALLEAGRRKVDRKKIVGESRIPDEELLDLIKRADMTRLRLMSGGMVRQFWAIGYKGIADLKKADPKEYFERVQEYYTKTAKGRPFDLTVTAATNIINEMKKVVELVEE
jgi:hypothetical protein